MSAPHSVDHILEAMFDGVISPGYLIRTGVPVLSRHTCRWNTLQASGATAEVRRWPPCEGVVHLPREGGVATGQLGGAEWAGWWSGWFVTVLEGEEGATWNGAGGREEGKGRGGGWKEEGRVRGRGGEGEEVHWCTVTVEQAWNNNLIHCKDH